MTAFVNTLNGKDGGGSHLIAVPPGSHFSEALVSSPVIQGEDGAGGAGLGGSGYEFGVDPNEDPELALVNISNFNLFKKYNIYCNFIRKGFACFNGRTKS